ncbi:TPA: CS1-pili formation C-terminal domain-containing protein [Photobacterium damselae]
MKKLSITIFFTTFTSSVFCYNVPDEFKEFYDYKEDVVVIKSVDGIKNDLSGFINANSVKIDSESAKKELSKFLKRLGVNDELSLTIMNDFSSDYGVSSSDKCIGLAKDCILYPKTYGIVFDYEQKVIYFYISPDHLNKKNKRLDFVNNIDKNPAVINSYDIFIGSNNSTNSITFNNNNIIGLKYGYVDSDLSYQINNKNNDNFELRKLAYILDYQSYQLQVGAFDGNLESNSTSFLTSIGDNTKNISVNIRDSKNLISNKDLSYSSLSFYTPSSGYLTIKKDDLIVFQKNVKAGVGEIPYSKLPTGVYNIELSIKSNGVEVLKQNLYVYNIKSGRLSKKDFDYSASIGLYNDEIPISNFDEIKDESLDKYKGMGYIDTSVTYGINDAAMFGSEFEITDDNDFKTKVGLSYLFENSSKVDIIYSRYKEGSYTGSVNVITPWFSFYYDSFDFSEGDLFALYKEGGYSRKSASLNKNFNITPVLNANLNYHYNEYSTRSTENKTWNISTSLDYRFNAGSIFNVQIMYDNSKAKYNENDQFIFNASVSIPFGNDLTYTSYVSTYDNSFDEFRNEISSDNIIDSKNAVLDISTGHSIYNDNYKSNKVYANITGNYSNDKLNSNMYAYFDSDGESNLSVSLSNTQIITKDNIYFTSNESSSYLNIDIKNDDERIDNLGLLTVSNKNKLLKKKFLNKKKNIIPLEEYVQFNGNIDTASVSLENNGEKEISGFSLPGSVYTLRPDVGKIVTFVAAFDDIFEQDVNDIACEGSGCVDIENIEGNVFNIKVRAGSEFMLYSDNLVCLTPKVKQIKNLNIGLNHCIPDVEDHDNGIMLAGPDGSLHRVYFVGIFNKNEQNTLEDDHSLDVIETELNDKEKLVFVSYDHDYILSNNDKSLIKKMMLTARNHKEISPFVLELDKSWFDYK